MIATACVLCGKDNSTQLYPANFKQINITAHTFSARRLPDKIHYRIVQCTNCGLVYSNPILPPKKIEMLYRKSRVNYDEQMNNLNATYGKYLSKLDSLVSSKFRLLEIGCGNGFFLEEAKRLGYKQVWGVEPGKRSVARAHPSFRNHIIVDIFRPKQFTANFFDVICMFQTFDHVTNPKVVLTECRRILKKNGIILVIVHDVSSWSAKLMGEHSPIIDIEHIYLYDKKTLPLLFHANNFQVIDLFDIQNIHTLGYWIFLMPLPLWLKRLTLFYLKVTGMEKIPLQFRAGNIGLIAKKSHERIR